MLELLTTPILPFTISMLVSVLTVIIIDIYSRRNKKDISLKTIFVTLVITILIIFGICYKTGTYYQSKQIQNQSNYVKSLDVAEYKGTEEMVEFVREEVKEEVDNNTDVNKNYRTDNVDIVYIKNRSKNNILKEGYYEAEIKSSDKLKRGEVLIRGRELKKEKDDLNLNKGLYNLEIYLSDEYGRLNMFEKTE